MTEFALSPDRREELTSLLGNEQRLKTEFPKLADYLSTAPNIPGTGNIDIDNNFDIRLIHYLAGGESVNPYWEIVAPLVNAGPNERDNRREVNGGFPQGSPRLAFAQMALQEVYAYAIPSPDTLAWISDICRQGGLLEIGAGRGYWAYLISLLGVDVKAFDSEPPDATFNVSFPDSPGQKGVWFPVGDLRDLANLYGTSDVSGRTLFLCWPPGWGDGMAIDSLKRFSSAGGNSLIYVGELQGGKNATDEFFGALRDEWELLAVDPMFTSWWNLTDVAQYWIRRA
ncbi:hypothetical protein [Nocardia sp. NPDC046763]|uniref:hypothetical protein n=1 Tax=Nocardia sp. NPDC046763 TaxID=3155256 RepID=UPI00340447B0